MIGLYNKLSEINYKEFNDPYSLCLRYKTGNIPKFFNIEKDFKLLSGIENNYVKNFLLINKNVYFIPLDFIDGTIIHFQLKARDSKSFSKIICSDLPMVYGWQDFKDYCFGQPIVLCEGIKDAEAIKLVYKYCLAYLTASPGDDILDYLKQITDKIFMISDNDKAGYGLKKNNKVAGIKKIYLLDKDAGTYWEGNDKILDQLKIILNKEVIE